jgi:prevent-host-death family protein
METLSLSEAKMKLSSLVHRVNTTDEEIIITKNGRPAAILVSPDEYDGWKETLLLHSDPGFLKELIKGIRALKQDNARLYTLEELLEE